MSKRINKIYLLKAYHPSESSPKASCSSCGMNDKITAVSLSERESPVAAALISSLISLIAELRSMGKESSPMISSTISSWEKRRRKNGLFHCINTIQELGSIPKYTAQGKKKGEREERLRVVNYFKGEIEKKKREGRKIQGI